MIRLGALLAVSALAITGCGGTADEVVVEAPVGEVVTTPAPGGVETVAPATGACAADTPLNIGLVTQGQNNVQIDNPWLPTSTGQILAYNRVRLEPLAVINRLDASVTPWLASELNWNDDYSSLTVTARDGINWSDGTPFTAEDIAATFITQRDTVVEGANTLDPQGLIGDITVDGNQVTIDFTRPRLTDWANVVQVPIMQAAYLSTIDDIMTDPMVGFPVTGPYDVTSFGAQTVSLARRDDYWGGMGENPGLPAVPVLNYVSYNDNAGLETALNAGAVQWSQSPLNDPSAFVASNPAYHVWWTPSDIIIEMMYLNTVEPPFSDPVFRRAANMVVNRAAWREITFQGQGELLTSATGLVLPAGDAFLDPTLTGATLTTNPGQPDVEAAQALLEEAGYLNVGVPGGLQYPNGDPVTLSVSAPSDWNDYVSSGAMVVQSLRNDLGADATFDAVDVDSWWEARSLGDFDAAQRAAGTTGIGPFWLYRDMIAQPGMGGWADMGEVGDWNLGRFENADVAAAFDTMQTSPDEAARTDALHTIQQVMVDESPVLLLGGRPIFSGYNTECYVNWPSDTNPYIPAQIIQPGTALMVVTSLEAR